jgi:hypothetical protein
MDKTESSDSEGMELNRRGVLKSIGATGVVTGMSGIGSANPLHGHDPEAVERAIEPYRNLEAVKENIAEQPELLRAISAAGFIEEASVGSLPIETFGEPTSADDLNVSIMSKSTEDGVTADIRADGRLNGGFFALSVVPETGESFAVFKDDDSNGYDDIYISPSAGCGPDCDDCGYTCVNARNATCDGTSYQGVNFVCQDGDW